jgi:6-phosphogluconolactonase (cycloisomerase 2 family)
MKIRKFCGLFVLCLVATSKAFPQTSSSVSYDTTSQTASLAYNARPREKEFVAAVSFNDGTLDWLRVNPDNTATYMGSYMTGESPASAVATSSFIYVANYSSATITGYKINSTGEQLTRIWLGLGSEDLDVPDAPLHLALSPNKNFLFLTCQGAFPSLNVYRIGPDGKLTWIWNYPQVTAKRLAVSSKYVAVLSAPNGSASDDLRSYFVNPTTGALTSTGYSDPTDGGDPDYVSFDSTGNYVFVTDHSSQIITSYQVGADGALNNQGSYVTNAILAGLAVHPSNRFVYVSADDNSVKRFDVVMGKLFNQTNVADIDSPTAIAFARGGTLAFVPSFNMNTIYRFLVELSSGAWSSPVGYKTGYGPYSVAVLRMPLVTRVASAASLDELLSIRTDSDGSLSNTTGQFP